MRAAAVVVLVVSNIVPELRVDIPSAHHMWIRPGCRAHVFSKGQRGRNHQSPKLVGIPLAHSLSGLFIPLGHINNL